MPGGIHIAVGVRVSCWGAVAACGGVGALHDQGRICAGFSPPLRQGGRRWDGKTTHGDWPWVSATWVGVGAETLGGSGTTIGMG
jgi:hypothetical protein